MNVAFLNTRPEAEEQNYSMLIHTSGKRVDHKADWDVFEKTIAALIDTATRLSRRRAHASRRAVL